MKKVRLYGLVTVILFIVPFAIAWSESFSGYTLFSPNNSRYTYLADMSNTVVHSWTHTVNGGYSVYLLDNGDIIRSAEANNSV
ncbi:MAG TPA: hypothetical protein DEO84_02930, partial [candidate division Zixibacteria bacterium]|nr:hypothetical protein [candidate division Zixibacteria bacterium]